MKKSLCIFCTIIFMNTTVYGNYIQNLDYPVPEQLVMVQPWENLNCFGGAYEFLPTKYEWLAWGHDIICVQLTFKNS